MNKEFIAKVASIQKELNAPKTQYNKFGDYWYRNLEDVLSAVKPLLGDMVLTMSDDIKLVGNEIYVFVTATLTDGENSISNTSAARETMTKKKYDSSQLTGSASSYARKYCLNGLFGIDDAKDADGQSDNGQQQQPQQQQDDKPWYNEPNYQADLEGVTAAIRGGTPPDDVIKQISENFKISNKYRDLIKAI